MTNPTGIIVIDGADCSGKTTLANYLKDNYGAEIIHAGMTNDPFKLFYDNVQKAIELSANQLVVLDRLWLSESAYGTVYRDGSRIPISSRSLDRLLIKHAAINVVAVPSNRNAHNDDHKRLSQSRHEEFSDITGVIDWYASLDDDQNSGGIDWINCYGNQYLRLNNLSNRPDYLFYDYMTHGQDIERFSKILLDRLKMWRESQWPKLLDPDFKDIVGHVHSSSIVFIGERLSDKTEWPYPFLWNESNKGAAHYFNSMLHAGAFNELTALWVNAENETNALADLCRYLVEQGLNLDYKLICLGNVAVSMVQKLGGLHPEWIFKDVVKVRHPSYVKRFDSGKDEKYLMEICKAIAS